MSLSFDSGVVLIAVCSALVTGLWRCVFRNWTSWLAALVVPFFLASCLYWIPVWHSTHSAEDSNWAGLFIGVWGLAGVAASAVVLVIIFIIGKFCAKRPHA